MKLQQNILTLTNWKYWREGFNDRILTCVKEDCIIQSRDTAAALPVSGVTEKMIGYATAVTVDDRPVVLSVNGVEEGKNILHVEIERWPTRPDAEFIIPEGFVLELKENSPFKK